MTPKTRFAPILAVVLAASPGLAAAQTETTPAEAAEAGDDPGAPKLPTETAETPAVPPPPAKTAPADTPQVDAPPTLANRASSSDMPKAHVEDPDMPVVRADAEDWSMFFRFGGLATMLAGNNTRTIDALMVTQVGMKYVPSEDTRIPFFLGFGIRHNAPDGGSGATDWGFDLGAGYEWHFRIWRRISPFFGLNGGLGLADPDGNNNLVFGLGLGPTMGVEYFIADRMSLTAQYLMTFQLEIQPEDHVAFQFSTLAGGALNLSWYF